MKLRSILSRLIKILLFGVIICGFGFFAIDKINSKKELKEFYPDIQEVEANLTKYYIYGRSLNIEGVLNESINKSIIKDVSLILKTKELTIPIKTIYEIEDRLITFRTGEYINDAIILDNIKENNYFLLLKITFNNEEHPKYYTLKNNTKYGNLEYYTITNNASNNYITVNFTNVASKPYMTLNVKNKKIPDSVYDIVLDPGHGGIDSGAVFDKYKESPINLSVAMKTKTELEKLGLKVKLTRDDDYNPGRINGTEPYGKGSRVSIPFEAKAKYMFSIHINSSEYAIKQGGLEIYLPDSINMDLARIMKNNILSSTNIAYSANPECREESGLYVRDMSKQDIEQIKKDAKDNSFTMYNIHPLTPYNYIIRETGGIATYAYVDGRNPKYKKNEYHDSNVGIETYLLELGYINNKDDIKIILNNQDEYAKAIAKSIENYILKNSY